MTHWLVCILWGFARASLEEALTHPDALAGFLSDEDIEDLSSDPDSSSFVESLSSQTRQTAASSTMTLTEQLESELADYPLTLELPGSTPVSPAQTTPDPEDDSEEDLWNLVLSALSEDAEDDKSVASADQFPLEQLVVLRSLQANIDMSSEELLTRIHLQRPESEWTLSTIDSFVAQAKGPIQIPEWLYKQILLQKYLKESGVAFRIPSADPGYNDPTEMERISQVWLKFSIDKLSPNDPTPYGAHIDRNGHVQMTLKDSYRYEYLESLIQKEIQGVGGLAVTGLAKKRRGSPTSSESSSASKKARPPAASLREAVLICMLRSGLGTAGSFVAAVQALYPDATKPTVNRMRSHILSMTIVPVAFHKRLSSLRSWEELTPAVLEELAEMDPRKDSSKRAHVWLEHCILKTSASNRAPCHSVRGDRGMTLASAARESYIRAELRDAHP